MDIQFNKERGKYVGYAVISDICAIHVVRQNVGRFEVEQSHVDDGNYTAVREATNYILPKNVDFVIEEKIFPLYLKFISDSEVISAQIIS